MVSISQNAYFCSIRKKMAPWKLNHRYSVKTTFITSIGLHWSAQIKIWAKTLCVLATTFGIMKQYWFLFVFQKFLSFQAWTIATNYIGGSSPYRTFCQLCCAVTKHVSSCLNNYERPLSPQNLSWCFSKTRYFYRDVVLFENLLRSGAVDQVKHHLYNVLDK